MNRKGQVPIALGIGIILAISIFLIGMGVLNILKPEITRARGADGLNCINASNISDGTKITCLVVDTTIPAYIWGLISLVASVTIVKLIGRGIRRR